MQGGRNIYILICPNENISYLKAEIKNLEKKDETEESYKSYKIVGYKLVYDFFNKKNHYMKRQILNMLHT